MRLVLDGPVFYGDADESHFFEWLAQLPAFERVAGKGTKLGIELRDPVDDETVLGLLVLCHRWDIEMSPLRQLRTRHNEQWFTSEQRWFWSKLWGKAHV